MRKFNVLLHSLLLLFFYSSPSQSSQIFGEEKDTDLSDSNFVGESFEVEARKASKLVRRPSTPLIRYKYEDDENEDGDENEEGENEEGESEDEDEDKGDEDGDENETEDGDENENENANEGNGDENEDGGAGADKIESGSSDAIQLSCDSEDRDSISADFHEEDGGSVVCSNTLRQSATPLQFAFEHYNIVAPSNIGTKPLLKPISRQRSESDPNRHVSFGPIKLHGSSRIPEDSPYACRLRLTSLLYNSAIHGNLEYFRDCVQEYLEITPEHEDMLMDPDGHDNISLIHAAIHPDNLELFKEVMQFENIKESDLAASNTEQALVSGFELWSEEDDDVAEESLIGHAAHHGSYDIMEYLLRCGVKQNFGAGQTSILHIAAARGHHRIIALLWEKEGVEGRDELLNALDGNGHSPLMQAISSQSKAAVRKLIEFGARVNVFDRFGRSALHYAVITNSLKIVQAILPAILQLPELERAALVNAQEDTQRKTALHLAVCPAIAEILKTGLMACDDIKDYRGRRVRDFYK